MVLPLVGTSITPEYREDQRSSHRHDKVHMPQSGRPTRSEPVRQDTITRIVRNQ
jgi:hypothetical protein